MALIGGLLSLGASLLSKPPAPKTSKLEKLIKKRRATLLKLYGPLIKRMIRQHLEANQVGFNQNVSDRVSENVGAGNATLAKAAESATGVPGSGSQIQASTVPMNLASDTSLWENVPNIPIENLSFLTSMFNEPSAAALGRARSNYLTGKANADASLWSGVGAAAGAVDWSKIFKPSFDWSGVYV